MKKIDINKNEITDQDALKHKDLGKVMDKYSKMKKPFYQSNFAKIGGSFIIVIAAFVIYQFIQQNESKEKMSNSSYSALYNSPIAEGIAFENIDGVVSAENSLTITAKSGTRITIPINTLVDSLGNLITGAVTFKFREFLDQKDIFLSGIPMNYDSAGVNMNFESGGMFELLAYQNNNPVFIAKEKSVQVELASKEVGDNFNIYYYSPEEERWVYNKKDEAGFDDETILSVNESLKEDFNIIENLVAEKLKLSEDMEQLKNQKPLKPKVLDKEKYSFTINVDYSDFPELKAFKGLKFQVSDKEKSFNPEYAKQVWEDVEIDNGTERNEYNTCFLNQKQKICFITNPVVDEKNISMANKKYDEVFEEYKTIKDSLKAQKKAIRKMIAKQSEQLAEKRRIELNRRNAQMANEMENKITRTFQIAQFGIWNSDCPQKLPSEAIVKATFNGVNGNELKFQRIYLVLKDRNEVISLTNQDLRKGLNYNPEEECMIWAVTNDNKYIGYVQSNQFKEIKNATSFTFNVDLIESKEFVTYSTQEIFNL